MNRTYRKNILRTIKQSLSRFMAIFAIVALGVSFLAGLRATTPNLRYSADRFFDENDLYDLRVVGTMGLTDEDVQAIAAQEGVEQVMPAYTVDAMVRVGQGDSLVAKVHSLPTSQIEEKDPQGYLNRLTVREGRLPVQKGECVVDFMTGMNVIEVGDKLNFYDPEQGGDSLAVTELKVVGIVQGPAYVSIEAESSTVGSGTVQTVVYTGEENFDLPVWTDVYLSLTGAVDLNSMLEEYDLFLEPYITQLETLGEERSPIRFEEVYTEAKEQLEEAEKQYQDAKAEADSQLADAEKELEDGQAEIDKGMAQLDAGKAELESGKQQLAQQQQQLPQTLQQAQQQVTDGEAQLLDAKAQYEAGKAQIEEQELQLQQAQSQLDAANQLIAMLEPALTSAQQALPGLEQAANESAQFAQQMQTQLEEAKAATQTAEQELAAQQGNLPGLEQNLQAAQQAVTDAQGQLTQEEWLAQDPNAAQLLAQRDAAQLALEQEQQRLAPYEQAVTQAQTAQQIAQQAADAAAFSAQRAQETYQQAQDGLASTQQQLDEAKAQIEENTPKLEEGKKLLEEGKAQLEDARQQILQGEKELAAGKTQLSLAPGLAQLQLQLAQQQLEDGGKEVEQGQQELEEAQQQLDEGRKEFDTQKADALAQLEDARQQIEDGQKQLNEMTQPQWYVMTRESNVGVSSLESNVQKVEAVSGVFPVFLFAVAALVALTTMTRMVEEERLQIGTFFALGYSRMAIMTKYVLYSAAAAVAGCVVGLPVGLTLFPSVIWNAYSSMYSLPKVYLLPHWDFSLFTAAVSIFGILLVTVSACRQTLKEAPAALLLPKAPKAGKRIFLEYIGPIWKRMKFTHKVTARNLFRYKKRFFMTVIGIAGCTSLLVTGFGLHDSIGGMMDKQYGELTRYDAMVSVTSEDVFTQQEYLDIMKNTSLVKDSLLTDYQRITASSGDESVEVALMIPQQMGKMGNFITLRERVSGKSVALSEDGVVITEKAAEALGVKQGDTIQIENKDGKTASFTVTGVVENYIQDYAYLSPDLYEAAFGQVPEMNMAMVQLAEDTEEAREQFMTQVLTLDKVASLMMVHNLMESMDNMLSKIDMIVVVLIVCAGLLAFVVLYNLTNINIEERVKEIATIKVLGFYNNEVAAYVYRESMVLSMIGTVLGLVLGVLLHRFVIQSVEVSGVMFVRNISTLSFVYSALLTLLFSWLVNLVMNRKLKNISMVESMKAPE